MIYIGYKMTLRIQISLSLGREAAVLLLTVIFIKKFKNFLCV